MATLSTTSSGRRVIQCGPRHARKTIHLGVMSLRDAETIRSHVQHLETHKNVRHPLPASTIAWLSDIGPRLHKKLVKADLVLARLTSGGIGAYCDTYIAKRTDLKEATIKNLKQAKTSLVKFFGAKRDLTTITRGDIGDWARDLRTKLATATVAMHIKKARQFFADAIDRRIIIDNPAKSVKVGSMRNVSRQTYVLRADVEKVIAACPDAEWRLIFALARYAGLRTPSETRTLRWADVNWDKSRITVRATKTEHHEDGGIRIVPIFPELLPYLREAFEQADEGAKNVITRHRGDNIRTQAERIIAHAGLVQWPKLFQNLRSSCETDLTASFPLHVVCAWIGNTETVALRYYLQVTDEHFDTATKSAGKSAGSIAGSGVTNPADKTQNAPEIEAFHAAIYPRREPSNLQDIAGSLLTLARAQAKALVRLHRQADRERRRDISKLRRSINAAKRTGRASR